MRAHLPFIRVTVIYCVALPAFHVSFNTVEPSRRSVAGYSLPKPSFDSWPVRLGFMVDRVEFGPVLLGILGLSAINSISALLKSLSPTLRRYTARYRRSTSSCVLQSRMNVVKFALLESLQTGAGFQQPSVLWAPRLLPLVMKQSGTAVDI